MLSPSAEACHPEDTLHRPLPHPPLDQQDSLKATSVVDSLRNQLAASLENVHKTTQQPIPLKITGQVPWWLVGNLCFIAPGYGSPCGSSLAFPLLKILVLLYLRIFGSSSP